MTLQWTEDLAIGSAKIDGQHKELIEKFNDFLEACVQRQGKEHLQELFEFLNQYVVLHFREEEELMTLHNYPKILEHKEQHTEFKQRLRELQAELDKAGPTISVLIHTNKALLYWLTTHIKQIDIQLGKHLNSEDKG